MGKLVKRVLGMGVLAGAGYALWRAYERRSETAEVRWEPQAFPFPPTPASREPGAAKPTAQRAATSPACVEPVDGECPSGYPVKAKLASGIFHVPGGQNYERTRPDRCYASAAAAEADGLRPAKR